MRATITERARDVAIFIATVAITYTVATWITGTTAEVIAR